MSRVDYFIYDGRSFVKKLDLSREEDVDDLNNYAYAKDSYGNCKYALDTRNNIVASHIEYSWDYYCFYLDIIRQQEDTHNPGRFQQYLDLGYLPIVAPPTYYKDYLHKLMRNLLLRLNIEIYNLTPSSIMNTTVQFDWQDIWISKYQAKKLVEEKPLHLITVRDVYMALNKRGLI